jgi:hypothetical protein
LFFGKVNLVQTEKKGKKNKKLLEGEEMVIRRGVDRRVVGFKVKKTRS